MQDSLEVMVGRIDERTESIQNDVQSIKRDITDLYNRSDATRSQMDTLQAEHDDRNATGDCTQNGSVAPAASPIWKTILSGVSGITSIIALIIVIALLAHFGLL